MEKDLHLLLGLSVLFAARLDLFNTSTFNKVAHPAIR